MTSTHARGLGWTLAAGLVAALALGGCEPAMKAQPAATPRSAEGPPDLEAEGLITDREMVASVLRGLDEEPAVRGQPVTVQSRAGIVTLSGSTATLLARQRAVEAAMGVKGVRAVVDDIALAAGRRSDAELRAAVEAAVGREPAARAHPIAIAARDGVVVLSGLADTPEERDLLADAARSVPGVTEVVEHVAIAPTLARPDAVIAAEVRGRLAGDPLLAGAPITVTVREGVVRLRGAAGSFPAKRRAYAHAWVAGTRDVDVLDLAISPRSSDRLARDQGSPERSDAEVVKALEDAFRRDPRLAGGAPDVAVTLGVVTLTGTLADPAAHAAAVEDAHDTVGAWEVTDDVVVKAGPPPDDRVLTEKVTRALALDGALSPEAHVSVTVTRGVAVLRGWVPTSFDELNAFADAAAVDGVVSVADELEVGSAPPAEPPDGSPARRRR